MRHWRAGALRPIAGYPVTGRSFSFQSADAARHGPTRIDQRFTPYPGVEFDDATYGGDAYPAFGWAACLASVDVDLDTGEVAVRDVIAVETSVR